VKWGTRGSPETRAERGRQSQASCRQVGFTLGVPDSDVQPSRQHKLVLEDVIRELAPRDGIIHTGRTASDPLPGLDASAYERVSWRA